MKLELDNITFSYNSVPVLHGVSFDVEPGQFVCLVGPNGSGKSTLIRCIDTILRPQRGRICLGGRDTRHIHRQELAKHMSYVPQVFAQTFPVTVWDSVLMGRRPHACWRSSERDLDKVAEVLELLGLEGLAMRDCNQLSGGQQQRVMVARALAQEPDVLLLDEPTSALDICHQLEVVETLIDLVRNRNIAAVMAVHDLNIAARYSDRVLMLKEGHIVTDGTPEKVFNVDNIAHVYGVEASIRREEDGKPSIVPMKRIGNGHSVEIGTVETCGIT